MLRALNDQQAADLYIVRWLRSHAVPVIRLMLVIMLVQSLFMALESGMQASASMNSASHHASTDAADGHADGESQAAATADGDDNCDHCCQCHGQCTHFAAAGSPQGPVLLARRAQLSPEPSQQLSLLPSSLYRPPITA